METILNSIAIICLTIAYILHLIYFHKPTKFEITKEELERQTTLQEWLEESRRAGEDYRQKTEKILSNVSKTCQDKES